MLLVRRGRAPALGEWSLPGGAQKLGETAVAAARREVREETGVEIGAAVLVAVVDSIHRDAAGRVEYHYTIVEYAAEWAAGEPVAGGDVTAAVWAELDGLGVYGLGDEMLRVIGTARQGLLRCSGAGDG